MTLRTETKSILSRRSLLTLLTGLLAAGFIVGCRDREAAAAPSTAPVTPSCALYRGSIEQEAAATVAAPAPGVDATKPAPAKPAPDAAVKPATDAIVGAMTSGELVLQVSPDHAQLARVEVVLKNVEWTLKTETLLTQTTMETCRLIYNGPFPIAKSGEFSVPEAGLQGRFVSPDRASGTLQLVYHENREGNSGTPGTHIPGTPAIRMPDGSMVGGTPDINIPGIPGIEGAHFTVKLGAWKCSLTGMTAAEVAEEARLVRQNLLRSVRYWMTYWTGPDERVQYIQGDDGNMKQVAETAGFERKSGESTNSVMTTRSLLIPNAPRIFRDDGSAFVILPDGTVDRLGDYSTQSIKKPGADEASMFMINDVDTDGKWIGRDGEQVFERNDDETVVQIGKVEYRDIVIGAGPGTTKVIMTKGMEPGAAWEGEVRGVTYREIEGGKPAAFENLEYRSVKCDDGKEHLLLMAQPVKGGPWVGVRAGRVYRQQPAQ
jgi:hypothetical protein